MSTGNIKYKNKLKRILTLLNINIFIYKKNI